MIYSCFTVLAQNNALMFALVDGSWSCWSSWSKCSVTCGGGHYMRTRTCSNPPPAYGGDICLGLHTEEALCNTQPCPGIHTCTHTQISSPGFQHGHQSITGWMFIFFSSSEASHAWLMCNWGHTDTWIWTQIHTHTRTHTKKTHTGQ